MKPLFDFLPLLAFFTAYKLHDIYVATAVLIAATLVQIIATKLIWKKVEKTHIITLVMVLFFGTLTLVLHDDAFIKWKVTAIYGAMAVALFAGQLIFKKPLLKSMLGKDLELPDPVYYQLGYAWAFFFAGCGVLNIYVAFNMPQETWVNFKVFGLTALTLLFALTQGLYIWRHLPKEDPQPLEQSKD